MFYVYILKSENYPQQIYTGYSTDLKTRFHDHNSGLSPHTKKFLPWKIIFYCSFDDEQKARDFEKYLKTASGIAFRNKRLI